MPSRDPFPFPSAWMDAPPEIVAVVDERVEDGIAITRLRFRSGGSVLYGIVARPAALDVRRHPAILVCHGGAACAEQVAPAARSWAERGYVSLCFDEPGICGDLHRSEGPWIARAADAWAVDPERTHLSLYEGVAAGLRALALLRSRDDVDPARVGIVGGSWGGYLTTMLSGLAGARVRTAFAVYGGGFFDRGTLFQASLDAIPGERRREWLASLDAGRRLAGIRGSFFFAAATNDRYFQPPSVEETYRHVPGAKNLVWSPNTDHCLGMPGGNTGPSPSDQNRHRALQEIPWMEFALKGRGEPFPRCRPAPGRAEAARVARFATESPHPVADAAVWHSPSGAPWPTRRWERAGAVLRGGTYRAALPDGTVDWFASITDSRAITVSTPLQRSGPG